MSLAINPPSSLSPFPNQRERIPLSECQSLGEPPLSFLLSFVLFADVKIDLELTPIRRGSSSNPFRNEKRQVSQKLV